MGWRESNYSFVKGDTDAFGRLALDVHHLHELPLVACVVAVLICERVALQVHELPWLQLLNRRGCASALLDAAGYQVSAANFRECVGGVGQCLVLAADECGVLVQRVGGDAGVLLQVDLPCVLLLRVAGRDPMFSMR